MSFPRNITRLGYDIRLGGNIRPFEVKFSQIFCQAIGVVAGRFFFATFGKKLFSSVTATARLATYRQHLLKLQAIK